MDYFDILLAKQLGEGGGGSVTIEQLDVTENGTYTEPGKAYRPVIVNLPLDEKTITANGTYNASDDNLQGYNKVVVNVAGYQLKAMTPGTIASFNDGQALPLTKLKIDIEPVQAGSGDPSPNNERLISGWSAANIANDTKYGGFIDFNQLIKNGNFVNTQNWNDVNATFTVSDNIATVLKTAASGYILQAISHVANHKYFKIATVKGTNGVTMYFNGEFNSIVLNGDWQTVSRIYNAPASEARYLNFTTNESSDFTPYYLKNIMYMDLTQIFGETKADEIYSMEQSQPGSGVNYVKSLFSNDYYTYNTGGTNTTVDTVNGETGRIKTVAFTDSGSPLTVYGGNLDVITGVLTVERVIILGGALSWTYESESTPKLFRAALPNAPIIASEVISSQYLSWTSGASSMPDKSCGITGTQAYPYLRVRDDDYTDATTFTNAVNDVQFCYLLSTPQTYQLTPTQINALLGVNNIFADTGDILEGEYFAAL